MATHSSILAWKIPWTEEPGGLQSIESQSRTPLKWLSTQRNGGRAVEMGFESQAASEVSPWYQGYKYWLQLFTGRNSCYYFTNSLHANPRFSIWGEKAKKLSLNTLPERSRRTIRKLFSDICSLFTSFQTLHDKTVTFSPKSSQSYEVYARERGCKLAPKVNSEP